MEIIYKPRNLKIYIIGVMQATVCSNSEHLKACSALKTDVKVLVKKI